MKVKIDELSAAISFELESYRDDIKDGLTEAIKRAASSCVRRLKETSPRKTGRYAESWTYTMSKPTEQPSATVYNKKYGFLSHLLEDGHGLASGGRVEGIPHIRPAADAAQKQLLEEVTELLEDAAK